MKKLKLAILLSVAAISMMVYYQHTNSPIDYKIDDRLIEANDTIIKLSQELGFNYLTIYSSRTNPSELGDAIPSEIYEFIEQSSISRIHFYDNKDPITAFSVEQHFTFFRPRWYYRYSESGLLDENIVSSLKEAVRQQNGPPYFLCQRAEVPNWFFCTAYDP